MASKIITYASLEALDDMREADIRLLDAVNLHSLNVDADGAARLGAHGDMSAIARFRIINPNIKFLLMLTGKNCSDAFVRRAGRARFAETLMEILKKYDLDGMDNDWEVPTMTLGDVNGRPEDKLTYTMLMKTVRAHMDAEELRTGRRYLLTCALSANLFVQDTVEVDKITPLVDYINVMTYDLRGVHAHFQLRDDCALPVGHHSNLFPSEGDKEGICAERAIEFFRAWGVPDDKIVIGAALYAKRYKDVPGENFGLMTISRTKEEYLAPDQKRSTLISEYMQKGYERHWDAAAKACWLYNPEKREFISYEDEQSISEKARYAKAENLAGIMFWEYSYDDTHALIPAAYRAMWGE